MKNALLKHDKRALKNSGGIIGIDEAGRGALAGPVIAAAAWVSNAFYSKAGRLKELGLMNDSKQLSAEMREEAFCAIEKWSAQGLIKVCTGEGTVLEIEEHNILGATRLAMTRGLEAVMLGMPEECRVPKCCGLPLWDALNRENEDTQAIIFVDGLPLKPFDYEHRAIIEGDACSLAIAMASIVAKVSRDRLMCGLSKVYPAYGFESHKGYGTGAHREAIVKEGPTADVHRTLFLRKVFGRVEAGGVEDGVVEVEEGMEEMELF